MIPSANLTPLQRDILKKYPTFKDFLTDYNPAQLLVNYDEITNIEQSISKRRMSISDIEIIYTDNQRNFSVEFVMKWIDFLNEFLNINKKLTEIRTVAYMIYKSYGHFYISDMKLIFEKITYAEYGTFYGSVDAQRILYGFMQYNIERMQYMQKGRLKFQIELEAHLDKVRKSVNDEARELMTKPDLAALTGPDYHAKKREITEKLLAEKLNVAREKFLTEYENKISNGKN